MSIFANYDPNNKISTGVQMLRSQLRIAAENSFVPLKEDEFFDTLFKLDEPANAQEKKERTQLDKEVKLKMTPYLEPVSVKSSSYKRFMAIGLSVFSDLRADLSDQSAAVNRYSLGGGTFIFNKGQPGTQRKNFNYGFIFDQMTREVFLLLSLVSVVGKSLAIQVAAKLGKVENPNDMVFVRQNAVIALAQFFEIHEPVTPTDSFWLARNVYNYVGGQIITEKECQIRGILSLIRVNMAQRALGFEVSGSDPLSFTVTDPNTKVSVRLEASAEYWRMGDPENYTSKTPVLAIGAGSVNHLFGDSYRNPSIGDLENIYYTVADLDICHISSSALVTQISTDIRNFFFRVNRVKAIVDRFIEQTN